MENKEEISIATIKAKTSDLCVKCNRELKVLSFGSGDIFSFSSTGKGALYCENNECSFFGVLTLARSQKTEKIIDMKENKK